MDLTSAWQRHAVAFTTQNVTSTNGRLRIAFSSVDDFYFDNVTLTPVASGAAVEPTADDGEARGETMVYLPSVRQQSEMTTSGPETAVATDAETPASPVEAAAFSAPLDHPSTGSGQGWAPPSWRATPARATATPSASTTPSAPTAGATTRP